MSQTIFHRELFHCPKARNTVQIIRRIEQPEHDSEGNSHPIADPVLVGLNCSGKIWCDVGHQCGRGSNNFDWSKCAHKELRKS